MSTSAARIELRVKPGASTAWRRSARFPAVVRRGPVHSLVPAIEPEVFGPDIEVHWCESCNRPFRLGAEAAE